MLRLLGLLLLVPLASGCVAVAAAGLVSVGVVQYERNVFEQDFDADLERTWQATLDALTRLEVVPTESALGPTEGKLTGEQMQITVERHAEGFTRVRVRVNTFHSADNERRAHIVLQEIETSIQSQDELRAWLEKSGRTDPPKP